MAGEYSWALSGRASESAASDALSDVDTNGSALAATYYFDPVDDSQGPYSLAAFFDPASRISLAMSRTRQTTRVVGIVPAVSDFTTTNDDYTLGGQYWLSASKWYAGGAYTASDIGSPFFVGRIFSRDDSTAYRVFAGKYLGPRTSLELGLRRSVREFGQVVDLCPPPALCATGGTLAIDSKTTTDDIGVSFIHVRRFRSLTYSLFGGVTETSGRNTTEISPAPTFPVIGTGNFRPYWSYSFGAEAFPTTKLGFRVGFGRTNYDGSHSDSYDVAATWFFKPNLAMQLSWSRSQANSAFTGFSPNNDTYSIRFIGRL
jgi:hypothetical protein